MTKKHFIAVAAAIKKHIDPADVFGAAASRSTASSIARAFADLARNENPKFDATRFYRACGLPPSGG